MAELSLEKAIKTQERNKRNNAQFLMMKHPNRQNSYLLHKIKVEELNDSKQRTHTQRAKHRMFRLFRNAKSPGSQETYLELSQTRLPSLNTIRHFSQLPGLIRNNSQEK